MKEPNRTRAIARGHNRRRARALAAAALAAVLLLQGGWRQATEDGRTDATARLREAVEREAARLRDALDSAERAQDYSGLVRRKLTVDAALAPLHLVRDAIEFVHGPDDGDLLRSFRAEWRTGAPTSRWSHAGAADRARRSLAEALGMDPDGKVRIHARVALVAWIGSEAPPAADWLLEGEMTESGPVVQARCIRVLPAFDAEHVAFPLPGTGFDIRWDERGAAYRGDDGTRHDEQWRPDACFDNPIDTYAVFDGLRLARSGDRRCRAATSAADEVRSMPIASVRSVDRADGSEVRRERWNWDGDALRSIEWSQPALSLLHRSPQASMIVAEAAGQVVSRTEHRPESAVGMPPIEAQLRWTGPGEALFTMQVDGEPWAFGTMHAEPQDPRIEAFPQPALGVREVDAMLQQAMQHHDPDDLDRALDAVEAFHASVDAPIAQRSAERELLALRLLRHGLADRARALLVGRWIRDLRAGEATAAIDRWCAAGEPALAAALAQASGAGPDLGSVAAGTGPCRADALAAREPAPECDLDRLPHDCGRFARCLLGAARTAEVAWLDLGRLASALCAACDRGELPALEDEALERLAAEVRAALAAGIGGDVGPDAEGEGPFVARAIEAARRPACPEELRVAMQRSWRAIEREATAALRAEDATDALAELRRRLRSVEALLGNRLAPDLDAATPAEPPASGGVRVALTQRIGAAIRAEERRAAIAGTILDATLAEARRGAVPGRVAREATAAAVDEYLRWVLGTRTPRAG